MNLLGAEIRNFYNFTTEMGKNENSSALVKIPHYQRPYKWKKDNIKLLIEDWEKNNEDTKNTDYFAGAAVTVYKKNESTLIDGQQRYTTLFLVNYIKFLILRNIFREKFNSTHFYWANNKNYLEQTTRHLFESRYVEKQIGLVENNAGLIAPEDFNDKLKMEEYTGELSELQSKYKECFGLDLPPYNSDNFLISYKEKLENILNRELTLKYDRGAYNKSLKKVLSKVCIKLSSETYPELEIIEKDESSENEKIYLDAIQTVFDSFYIMTKKSEDEEKEGNKDNSIGFAEKMVNKIEFFLTSITLCVIQTNEPKDAYTLFEVLNDRALALDDLDLIKNQFYKTFCMNGGVNDDVEIDRIINIIEEQWGTCIFNDDSSKRKKLIAFLATSFFSGNNKIKYDSQDYRKEIEDYLDEYKKSGQDYDSNIITTDFNIFEASKLIIEKFKIQVQGVDLKALQAEYSRNFSQTYKTIHLLIALKQYGVLAGLINLILKSIHHEIDDFEPCNVRLYLDELIKSNTKQKIIEAHSKHIWQLVILGKNYELAKSYSDQLLKKYCKLKAKDIRYDSENKSPLLVSYKEDFESWLNSWSFNNSIKVKILFARLIKSSKDDKSGKLIFSPAQYDFGADVIATLHLDHMEPSKIDITHVDDYFQDNMDRDYHLNGLGNMFPLPAEQNIPKSNSPLKFAFKYINEAGLDTHWLGKETKKLFDSNNNNNIPRKNFFSLRKDFLIKKFYEVCFL